MTSWWKEAPYNISDDTGRIAMLEMRNTDYDADGCEDVLTRLCLQHHLQSATLELDADGEIISYEERRSPHEHKKRNKYEANNITLTAPRLTRLKMRL